MNESESESLRVSLQTWQVVEPYFSYLDRRYLARQCSCGADGMLEFSLLGRYLFRKWTRRYDTEEFAVLHTVFRNAPWESIRATARDDCVEIAYRPHFEMGRA